MDERTKELVAIGASVSANCQPCLTYHLERARELGISEESIHAAMDTGYMVSKGATSAMRKFSTSLMNPDQSECGYCASDNDGPSAHRQDLKPKGES